jgi:hypothetical protein
MSTFWEKMQKWSPWTLVNGLYQRITSQFSPVPVCEQQPCCDSPPGDLVLLQLADLQIHVRRQKPVDVPHEITVVVPRVEIRRKYSRPDGFSGEEELIYNSVTVVHAPRHEPTGEKTIAFDFYENVKNEATGSLTRR